NREHNIPENNRKNILMFPQKHPHVFEKHEDEHTNMPQHKNKNNRNTYKSDFIAITSQLNNVRTHISS
ncbi:MAG: hypothetical protein K2F69_02835, partial [Bacteroidaceae bacterium]|nr:hypothetical protein [Bacteroidaceae bacterium]